MALFPPIPVVVHLTRLARLQPPGVGSARRTRAWLTPFAIAAMLLLCVGPFVGPFQPIRIELIVIAYGTAFGVIFGAVQHEHNALIRHVGTPLPYDDPCWHKQVYPGEQRQPTIAAPPVDAPTEPAGSTPG
jgi:hypothetical protein